MALLASETLAEPIIIDQVLVKADKKLVGKSFKKEAGGTIQIQPSEGKGVKSSAANAPAIERTCCGCVVFYGIEETRH